MARNGIESGELQLWRVSINLSEVGYLVTERYPREIFVWAYQGKDSLTMLRALGAYGVKCKIPFVGFFTTHKGFTRLFGKFRPQVNSTELPGEMQFRLNSEVLAHGG